MKKNTLLVLIELILMFTQTSCTQLTSVNKTIEYTSNGALFRVTNVSTGEIIYNKGIVVASTIENTPHLDVNKGDTLIMEYDIPQRYSSGVNISNFRVFDEEYTIAASPYLKEIIVPNTIESGLQLVICVSTNSLWTDNSYDKGIVYLNVLN